MFKKTKNEKNIYGIIGLGRFGYALAAELAKAGADLIVLDSDEDKIREMREYTENAYIAKNLDRKTLLEAGLSNCDTAVVCISEHLDASILITLHLKAIGVRRIISKAGSYEHGEILEMLGAQVVYPERDMALRLAHRLEADLTIDYVQLSEKLNITKLHMPEKMAGKTVIELNLRKNFSVNIIAVENEKGLNQVVSPDYRFQKDDILFVSGSSDALNRFTEWAE